MPYIPLPPTTSKKIHRVIAVKDGYLTVLNAYLDDGWKVINTTAAHGGGDSTLFGYVYFTIEKYDKI